MRIVVLGGSYYFGRLLADGLLRQGHAVAVFNGGRSASQPPAGVLHIQGQRDREDDLSQLAQSGPWDVVIDVSGKLPAVVRRSVRALRHAAERYVYVSTVEVYRDWPHAPVDETSPLWHGNAADAPPIRLDHPDHGPSRADCESACHDGFGNHRLLILRLHAVVGGHEYAGPLLAWIERMRRGGAVLVPAPDQPIQAIDVRDAVDFLSSQVVRNISGVFNVGVPAGPLSYGKMLRMCAEAAGAGSETEMVWADGAWLAEQGVAQWTQLPLWSNAPNHWSVNMDRAVAAGLQCRSLAETLADVLRRNRAGNGTSDRSRIARFGIDPELEAEVIARWRSGSDR